MSGHTSKALSFNSQTSKLSVSGKDLTTTDDIKNSLFTAPIIQTLLNIDGSDTGNIAFGAGALSKYNSVGFTASGNIALGDYSLERCVSSGNNTAIGQFAGQNCKGGSNTLIGNESGRGEVGANNSALGNHSLTNGSGDFNVAIGYYAGSGSRYLNTSGKNTFLGASSDLSSSGAQISNSTAIGYNSKITASNQIVLGTSTETVRIPKFTTAGIVRNTASGDLSASGLIVAADITNNTLTNDKFVGNNNNTNSTAFGNGSLLKSTAHNNTAIGCIALENNTTGNNNTAVGFTVLNKNTTGGNNTAVGFKALELNTTGENNTAHGFVALNENTTGSNNTAHGFLALQKNTTGINNSAHGFLALQNNTTGEKNTSIGNEAGINNKTNNNNTFLGANSDLIDNTNTWSNSTAIGFNSKITASNQIVLGTSSETVRIPKLTTAGVVRNTASGDLSASGLIVAADITDATITNSKLASGIDKSKVGLGNVDNTSDADKPVSTAQQTALDAKAPLASPSFTGTVSGITKAMVGLTNVTDTSDADKPVSTAQQTALDAKANKSELNIMPTTPPQSPVIGAFWFDISTGDLNIYNGEGWISFSPSNFT
jgi:hypothetical protein